MNRPRIRCAIYTRKSTEEGLEQEFNSLDAQREAGEAYIASQKAEGWVCLEQRYDDGGFTGGNLERPAMRRLLADIEAGKVDCVVVYKVDRLSRSLLDFSRIMEIFEKQNISFVSVTQQFNTTHSMGRLTLNILLSFAQFEREIISERTRDKIAAARRRGKWSGGKPILGYDLDRAPSGSKLKVNPEEARQVREIFTLYLSTASLIQTAQELNRRGWRSKAWVSQKGRSLGGKPFDKSNLLRLLTNVAYVGKVKYKVETHEGEQEAIVDQQVFEQVQAVLRANRSSGGAHVRNKYAALLKGLVRCGSCGRAMTHHFTSRKEKRYRYYVCQTAQKQGWASCPTASVPAGELERFVVEQIRLAGRDSSVIQDALAATQREQEAKLEGLTQERHALGRRLQRITSRLRQLVGKTGAADVLADLQDELRQAEQQASHLDDQIARGKSKLIDDQQTQAAMEQFQPVWASLSPSEQARVIHLLVQRVEFDGEQGRVSITFRANGIKTLAQQPKEQVA